MTTDSYITTQYLKLIWAEFLIFVLESTASPVRG